MRSAAEVAAELANSMATAVATKPSAPHQQKMKRPPLPNVSDQRGTIVSALGERGFVVYSTQSSCSPRRRSTSRRYGEFQGHHRDFASSVGSVGNAHNTGMSMTGLYSVLDEMTQHGFTAQRATDDMNHTIEAGKPDSGDA